MIERRHLRIETLPPGADAGETERGAMRALERSIKQRDAVAPALAVPDQISLHTEHIRLAEHWRYFAWLLR